MVGVIARFKQKLRFAKRLLLPSDVVAEELIVFRTAFRHLRTGVMIDVGAHFGDALLPFAVSGWEVYAIEPDPANLQRLSKNYRHFRNVRMDDRAIGAQESDEQPFFTSMVSSGISTLKPFHHSHKATLAVRTVRLSTYCREKGIGRIEFLKIDVEGLDLAVLQSHDWTAARPEVVMCEFEDRKTKLLGHDSRAIAAFLGNLGYHVGVSEWHPVTEYGRRHNWRRAYAVDDRPIPDDSWGNFIAASTREQLDRILRGFPHSSFSKSN